MFSLSFARGLGRNSEGSLLKLAGASHCLKPSCIHACESEDAKRVAADKEFAKQKQSLVEAEKAALGQSIASRRALDSDTGSLGRGVGRTIIQVALGA